MINLTSQSPSPYVSRDTPLRSPPSDSSQRTYPSTRDLSRDMKPPLPTDLRDRPAQHLVNGSPDTDPRYEPAHHHANRSPALPPRNSSLAHPSRNGSPTPPPRNTHQRGHFDPYGPHGTPPALPPRDGYGRDPRYRHGEPPSRQRNVQLHHSSQNTPWGEECGYGNAHSYDHRPHYQPDTAGGYQSGRGRSPMSQSSRSPSSTLSSMSSHSSASTDRFMDFMMASQYNREMSDRRDKLVDRQEKLLNTQMQYCAPNSFSRQPNLFW